MMSWWGREVCIWRINKLGKPSNDAEESEHESEVAQNRKLVARIIIKGEANIASASIATDGSLLVVSTAADIKVFQLKSRKSVDGDALKVSKIAIPESLSRDGSKLVQISPDGRWLGVVRSDNKVCIARIVHDKGVPTIHILNRLSKMHRLDRKIAKHISLGGLGSYDRSINRMSFSANGSILAVSDISGYVDTWVLEGLEDLAQTMDDEEASVSSADEEPMSETDEEKQPTLIYGQHWIRNPSAFLLPKMPSTPTVLSFRPSSSSSPVEPSTPIPHPTRQTPHPHAHNLPTGEDRLLVVTAGAQVLELHALTGSLTPWSRANPTSHFPAAFRGLKDHSMGCVWDVSDSKERLWLYGSNWLWMFDLSRDFPVIDADTAVAKAGGKRKRLGLNTGEELEKGRSSGAGNKVRAAELETGVGRKLIRVTTAKIDGGEDEVETVKLDRRNREVDADEMDIDGPDVADDSEEDDEDVEEDGGVGSANALSNSAAARGQTSDANEDGASREMGNGAHWWHTFKYRPIMGVVSINDAAREGGPLEVALIERPSWEMDLPPRYYGDQEWEKGGV